MTDKKLKKLEQKLNRLLEKKKCFFINYISCNNASVCPDIFIEIKYELRGDRVCGHFHSAYLIQKFIKKKKWVLVETDKKITDGAGYVWYEANYVYKVGINKKVALAMKHLFEEK